MTENKFLTSVADVKLFDDKTGDLILNGKTLLNSSITQAIQSQAIHAGKGSKKIFEYNYQKELSFSIEDATFNTSYICLQNNTKVLRELADYYTNEFITLDSTGKGTLSQEPVGNIHVENENGMYTQIIPNGKDFTYPTLSGQEVQVSYAYKEMMDNITLSADSFPKAVRMVLNGDIMTNNGKEEEMQIVVPKFKPDGAMELSMTHDGVSSSALAGTSLADNKGNYAYISFKTVNDDDVPVIKIAASPSEIDLDSTVSGDSEQITVYGIRGGSYGVVLLDNTKLTFTSDEPTIATVDADGLVTLGTAANAGDTTVIRITDGKAKDIVEVTVL